MSAPRSEPARKQFGPEDPRLAGVIATLGQRLIMQGKWLEAEPVLRECLAIREKLQPDELSLLNGSRILKTFRWRRR